MTSLEVEVKFYIGTPEAIRGRIQALKAIFSGRRQENNIRFEDSEDSLISKKSLLRLRKTGSLSLLTYKGESQESDRQFKIHREYEVEVSDFDVMSTLLQALGYRPAQRYEKIRETYELKEVVLCIDQMPYGNFLEIEGQPESIRQTAKQLGLDWGERIIENYLAIFEVIRKELNLGFNDVTFENFRNVSIDFSSFLPRFTAEA